MAFALRCAALLAACAASLACSRSCDSVLRSGPSYERQHSAKGLNECKLDAAHALANTCAMSHCRARVLGREGPESTSGLLQSESHLGKEGHGSHGGGQGGHGLLDACVVGAAHRIALCGGRGIGGLWQHHPNISTQCIQAQRLPSECGFYTGCTCSSSKSPACMPYSARRTGLEDEKTPMVPRTSSCCPSDLKTSTAANSCTQ